LKVCSKCKVEKPLEVFGKHSNSKDGKQSYCTPCHREATRLNRLKNLEVRREYDRNYCKQNRERKTKNFREWRHKNPDKLKATNKRHYKSQRAWLKQNSDLTAFHAAQRRAMKKQATPPWVDKEHKQRIKAIYKSAKTASIFHEIPYHVDHIEPIKGVNEKGEHVSSGLNVWWNLQILPAEENIKKSNKIKTN
jgi:hypothetical protein